MSGINPFNKPVYLGIDLAADGADVMIIPQRRRAAVPSGTTVIYNRHLRPITVFNLTPEMAEMLTNYQYLEIDISEVLLAKHKAFNYAVHEATPITATSLTLKVKWLENPRAAFIIADDEEAAMNLDPAFLPGQHQLVYKYLKYGHYDLLREKV